MFNNVKFWKTLLVVFLVLVIASFFTGCSTTKYVPTPVTVYEKSQNVVNDSIINKRFVEAFEKMAQIQENFKESKERQVVHEKDSIAPIYDNSGKKVGEDHFHVKEINTVSSEISTLNERLSILQAYKDSCSLYKSNIDSLNELKNKIVPCYIDKKLNVVQKTLMALGGVLVFLFLWYILLVVINFMKRLRC